MTYTDENGYTAEFVEKGWLVSLLESDFFGCGNSTKGELYCSQDDSINVYIESKFYPINQQECDTRSSVKELYGMTFNQILDKADYIEYANACDIFIWHNKKHLPEQEGWVKQQKNKRL